MAPFVCGLRLKQLRVIVYLAVISGESLELIMEIAEHLSNFASRRQVVFV
ncbi:MAG TPA: hypothetical protein VNE42_06675 [Acidimicrobiales bacterium]|nr:hypothetical protein [Acidimicrobiales bacterium]